MPTTNSVIPSNTHDLLILEDEIQIPENMESQELTNATLLDADGQVLSKGGANLDPDKKRARFYPRDLAQLNTLRSHVKTLLLTDRNESLSILGIEDCQGHTDHLVHWHLTLT